MRKPKGGLGRGLQSLIPQSVEETQTKPQTQNDISQQADRATEASGTDNERSAGGLLLLPVSSITPNPRQPRQSFRAEELDELADSIRAHGILQPVVVARGDREGQYYLIAGERRWRASALAGLERVPALLKEATSRQMLEMALVENVQRADLNPLEQAGAYRSLVEEFGLKQDEVALRVGKSRTAVNNALRLLHLPLPAQEALAANLITEGHARALLQVPEGEQLAVLQEILERGWSVRQVEAKARSLTQQLATLDREERTEPEKPLYDPVRDWEDRFRTALSTKVQLSKSSRGGKVVIYFSSDEELGRIYDAIVGEE